MTGRRVSYAVSLLALVATGTYVIVYLVRWEWHRALVAGVFLLGLEIGIGFAYVVERLHEIERRLAEGAGDRQDETRRAVLAARPEPGQPFAWLDDAASRMSVFVPILLGAGVVLSALAWVVEHLARLTARPALERGLVLRLEPFTLAPGTLAGAGPVGLPPHPSVPRRSWRWVVLPLAVIPALLLGQGIDVVADATQNRPDATTAGSAGRVVLRVDGRGTAVSDADTARALWGACAVQIGATYRLTGVEALDGDRVELRVRPAVGTYAERRLRGCFEDAITDRVSAEVLEVAAR